MPFLFSRRVSLALTSMTGAHQRLCGDSLSDSLSLSVKTVENSPGLSGRCIDTISILNGNLRIVSVDGSVRQVAVLNVQ